MHNELAALTDRINGLLARMERRDYPSRGRLEDTLTDGYAYALSLDAECERIERRLAEHAAELTEVSGEEHTRQISTLAQLLGRRRDELDSLRSLLAILRTGVQEPRVA